jgi:prolyl oligopeptidase
MEKILFLLLGTCLWGASALDVPHPFVYPAARKDDVVDNYHGTSVPDPYRWLEDPASDETRDWVEAESRITEEFLQTPDREKALKRLTQLWNYPKYSVPSRHGNRYFSTKNDGLQNQSVVLMQRSLDGETRVVIDPNALSEDGTVALSGSSYSHDGKLMAYGLSAKGSDREVYRVRNIDTGKDEEEVLKWCKFTSVAWKHDQSGFFYNRFPEPGSVPPEDENNFSTVYWHRVGTPQTEDVLVYRRPDDKELTFSPHITEDGKYLVLYVTHGTDPKNRVYYREVESEGPFVRLLDEADASYDPIENVGSVFYFHTDLDAPRGRVIAIDLEHPDRKDWKEIIPAQEDPIDFVAMAGDRIVACYLHNAYHRLCLYQLDGKFDREIPLPGIGSIGGLSGKREDREMFFAFTSFLFPTSIYRYDFETGKVETLRESGVDFDRGGYETEQVFCESKDGTRIPMFITRKKGLVLDGSHPVLLYGYGGFNASLTPSFSITRVVWLEAGGVFAVANTRGGAEYGEAWHKAGSLENKQTVFDDFISAGQWLVDNKYTSPSRLAIQGGSNGGLLVAACMLQRPDLFGAVVCQVPVTDMLRYHKFTVGRYWIPEYGNAEADPAQFKYLYAYSPLHNVHDGVSYPPVLITTADTDDRVAPLHAKKFAATLQAKAAKSNPILLRVETKAGHGGGKPTSKVIEESADFLAFLFKVFGMTLPEN